MTQAGTVLMWAFVCVHLCISLRAHVRVCVCVFTLMLKAKDNPHPSHTHHLGTDTLTTDGTLLCWLADRHTHTLRQTERQTGRQTC